MEDGQIVELYWQRDPAAIAATAGKYGPYCFTIAHHILGSREDAEECVNDTWLNAWNAMPPQRPARLRLFLARITRNLSFSRFRAGTAKKRGGGEIALALEELGECASQNETMEDLLQRKQAEEALNRFLATLPETERNVLLCRYWYMDSIGQIAGKTGFTASKVTSMLHRTRGKLRKFLEKEALL